MQLSLGSQPFIQKDKPSDIHPSVSNYFQRIEPLRWTPYLDECLRLLHERREYPTDELFVYLVRVQLICNKSMQIAVNDTDPICNAKSGADQEVYAQVLRSQLEELRFSLSPELISNGIHL